jgi:predicted nuclease of predicted toxin-antitoxin system
MRVLLDECCPKPLKNALTGAEVFTVEMAGIKGVKNGELVKHADNNFDVLITADKNLRYQQQLANHKVAIIELPFNSWKRVQSIVPQIQNALTNIRPGQYVEIPAI